MDPIVKFVLILIALSIILRIRYTIRKTRMSNKGDQIQDKLKELRKKRDEE